MSTNQYDGFLQTVPETDKHILRMGEGFKSLNEKLTEIRDLLKGLVNANNSQNDTK